MIHSNGHWSREYPAIFTVTIFDALTSLLLDRFFS